MPDHLHALISFPAAEQIVPVWRDWKRFTAKAGGIAWQRDIFEHRLRAEESAEEKAHYIRQNPVRQGLITSAADWPWLLAPYEQA